jgi:hypothetical protein
VADAYSLHSAGALNLMTLGMVIEDGLDPRHGPRLHKRMVRAGSYKWLAPPLMDGRTTVLDVLQATRAGEHEELVRAWADDVWEAWAAHHRTVRLWIERSLS